MWLPRPGAHGRPGRAGFAASFMILVVWCCPGNTDQPGSCSWETFERRRVTVSGGA
jgi:hypothetical protein